MAYRVEMTRRAERDPIQIYQVIEGANSITARRWYRGLKSAILSLEEMPERCAVTPENARLRHLLFGRRVRVYRVIFRIMEREKRIEVLHIRHGAREGLGKAGRE